MTKKLLSVIIFVILAGFVFWSNETFADEVCVTSTDQSTGQTTTVCTQDNQTQELSGDGCTPLSAKLAKSRNCFFCPLFKILFTAAASVSVASFANLATPFRTLLLIGWGLYIGFLTLRQVSSFTKQDGSKYISEMLTMSFKVFLVFLLLSNGSQVYRLALEPILSAGLEAGSSFLSTASADNPGLSSCTTGNISGTDRTFYSDALEQKIDCFLRKVAEETAVSHTIGSALWCASVEEIKGFPKFSTAAAGGLVIFLSWLISIAFAFYLIDAVIRLGIIGAILPFLLAAWPFKITSGYTSKGWSMFLNAFFVFVFLGLIISVVVQLLASAVTGGSGSVETILNYIATDNISDLAEAVKISGTGFIFLALCGLFGFKLCKEASSMAAEMGTSGGTAIGSKIGGLAMNAAQTGGKKALHGAAGAGRLAAHAIPMPFAKGESVASFTHKAGDWASGKIHGFTKKATSFLTPEGRISNRSGGSNGSETSSLNDNQTPTSPIGGRRENNNPLPNNDNNTNNFESFTPNTVPGEGGGGNPTNTNRQPGGSGAGGNVNDYDASLGNEMDSGAIPMGDGSRGSYGQPATGGAETSADGGNSNVTASGSSASNSEMERAENTAENREPSEKGSGASQAEKQNIDEIARRAAEAAAARVMGQNQQPSNETPLQNTTMKEGKVYAQNGKLQSETTRGADGNLVKTNYDKDGNISSIISEDKNGNREWSRYDTQGNVVESGNMKMETAGGKSYIASQQVVKGGVSTTQNFYANGKMMSELVQTVGKDGQPGEMLKFRQFNEKGQVIASQAAQRTDARAGASAQPQDNRTQTGTQTGENQQKHNIAPQNASTAQTQPNVQTGENKAQPNTQTEGKQSQPNTQAPGTQAQPNTQAPGTQAQPTTQAAGTQVQPNTQAPGTQAQPNTQTGEKQAQPNTQTKGQQKQTQAKKPIERLQEGVIRDEEGRMRSETVKHDNGKSTRVLYNENGKIYDVAEEDEKGNRQWQSFDDNGRPTEHGNRTINDDGSVSYKVYDNYDRIISETVENTDGSVSQTMYKGNGEAYLRIDQDKDGNISYNGISAQQAPKDESLKPEESSNMAQPRKLDKVDVLMDILFKEDQKAKSSDTGKKGDDEAERNKLRVKELEALVVDLRKSAKGLKGVGGRSASLADASLGALKQELQRRGIKVGG